MFLCMSGSAELFSLMFFFFKQRTAYDILRSDWSSDVCSSDLETMAGFGNSGRMLPEQVWDREHPTDYGWEFGEGTGGATPLAWTMAGYIRLAHGVDAGEPVETPGVVRNRYVERDRPAGPELTASVEYAGENLVVSGETTGSTVAVYAADGSTLTTPEDGEYAVRLDADTDVDTVVVAAATTDAADAEAALAEFVG